MPRKATGSTGPFPWFVVVGRAFGDDEATVEIIQAGNAARAQGIFEEALRGDFEPPAAGKEGYGTVYIDGVVNCGYERPVLE